MRWNYRGTYLALIAFVAVEAGAGAPACAQVRFDARYTLSMAGLSIGKLTWQTQLGTSDYSTMASGQVSGFLSLLMTGEGKVAVKGQIRDGRPRPASFFAAVERVDEKIGIRMTFDDARVRELKVDEPPPESDRVPIADWHKVGVMDPLSAFLIPGPVDPMARETCERSLAIFDGRRRYELTLSFKRTDMIKGDNDKRSMAIVCTIRFTPMSGHRASSPLVKFLSEGRDIEVWLVPIAGTRILAPVRLSVASLVGNMVLQADEFETTALALSGK
ncbi:DUF3108 domain-containing protein [Pseudorhodoplanes sp.]|uniref:DUF3108 domain-containing protein n=1 Tax=Pseudorhodoplanes sp. TaxID=1934341 RepID=UPI003D124DDF